MGHLINIIKSLVHIKFWYLGTAVVVAAGGGSLTIYAAAHGGLPGHFGAASRSTRVVLTSPFATATVAASPIIASIIAGNPTPSSTPDIVPAPAPPARVALSAVQIGVRRCSPACPNKASDASAWYGGGMSVICGGRDAETIHIFEGYSYTWTGSGPPIQITVHWTGTYKYTSGKDYTAPADTHDSQPVAFKALSGNGVHTFEESKEYVVNTQGELSYAAIRFDLTWTNADGTNSSAPSPGVFQMHCIYPPPPSPTP
ncbi:MAG: hypothetical protein ACYDGR_07015 [Candidatus Dormibacteria bacterium]